MNDYEQEISKNQERVGEPSALDNVQIKMNSSSNDMPGRSSDANGEVVDKENIDIVLPGDELPVQSVIRKSVNQNQTNT